MADPHAAGAGRAMGTRRSVVAVLALAGTLTAAATGGYATAAKAPSKPAPFADGKYFLATCSPTHRNNDDPIVAPGQPGRSHNHTFAGNRSTDALSTPESLRANATRTTCQPTADASAYWFPTVYARGQRAVMPLVTIVYYIRRTGAVEPLPPGLKVVAGNARARRPQSANVAYWTCGSPLFAGAKRFPHPPNCSVARGLNLTVTFPDCWDGRRLDSADHRRHMAYSKNRRCPGAHPVAVPAMKLIVVYPAARNPTLSSGRFSAHADFMNGWEQDFLGDRVRGLNH